MGPGLGRGTGRAGSREGGCLELGGLLSGLRGGWDSAHQGRHRYEGGGQDPLSRVPLPSEPLPHPGSGALLPVSTDPGAALGSSSVEKYPEGLIMIHTHVASRKLIETNRENL